MINSDSCGAELMSRAADKKAQGPTKQEKTMFFKDSSRLKIYRQLKRLERLLIFTIFINEPTISAMKEAFF